MSVRTVVGFVREQSSRHPDDHALNSQFESTSLLPLATRLVRGQLGVLVWRYNSRDPGSLAYRQGEEHGGRGTVSH